MIEIELKSKHARFLADCVAARRPALREALADAMTSQERVSFREMLAMADELEKQLLIGAYANERVIEMKAGQ